MNPNQPLERTQTIEEWSMLARAVMSLIITAELSEIPQEDMKLVKYLTSFFSDINQEIIELSFKK